MIALPFLLLITPGQKPSVAEPEAFTIAKKLVGGIWRGNVGGKVSIETRYKLVANGKVVESDGIVGDSKKPFARIHARIGIDPSNNSVFYLDTHNDTTVYFGQATSANGNLTLEFAGLSGDKGRYKATIKFNGPDSYASSIIDLKSDGKEGASEPIVMKRAKN